MENQEAEAGIVQGAIHHVAVALGLAQPAPPAVAQDDVLAEGDMVWMDVDEGLLEEDYVPGLDNLFQESFNPQPENADLTKVYLLQHTICKYLNQNDLKNLMAVNHFCYSMVNSSPSFCLKNVCKISDKWHWEILGSKTLGTGVAWRYFHMEHFAYHRNLLHFKNYWKKSSKQLLELTISLTVMECDGTAFILNECTKLNTLRLDQCKLKHWSSIRLPIHDNGHRVTAGNVLQRFGVEEVANVQRTLEMRQELKNLSINAMQQISPCTFKYLERRSGFLECLEICNFFKKKVAGPVTEAEAGLMLEYTNGLIELIKVNQASLRTLSLDGNAFQSHFLQRMTIEFPDGLPVTQLSLSVPDEDGIKAGINAFIRTVTPQVSRLFLRFDDFIMAHKPNFSQMLEAVVSPLFNVLRSLEIRVKGGTGEDLGPEENAELVNNIARIGPILEQFQGLESIEIIDNKDVNKRQLLTAQGEKETKKGVRATEEAQDSMQNTLKTPFSTDFLTSLPNTVQQLSLKGVMLKEPFFMDMNNLRNLRGYRTLTKLELIGPLFHPVKNGFGTITKEMLQLQTLIIVDCDLSDATVTGLSADACCEMRRSEMIAVSLMMGEYGHDPLQEMLDATLDFEGQILQQTADALNDAAENVQPPAPVDLTRPHIYTLQALEHLDLSMHNLVTDVTIFDSIRSPRLKVLKLNFCTMITDVGLKSIAKFNPNLEEVHVKGCRRLSMLGFENLIQKCKMLKVIQTTKAIAENNFETGWKPSPVYGDVIKVPKLESLVAPDVDLIQ